MLKQGYIHCFNNTAREKAIDAALSMYIILPLHTHIPQFHHRPVGSESDINSEVGEHRTLRPFASIR